MVAAGGGGWGGKRGCTALLEPRKEKRERESEEALSSYAATRVNPRRTASAADALLAALYPLMGRGEVCPPRPPSLRVLGAVYVLVCLLPAPRQ